MVAATVASVEAPGWMFLEERIDDMPSMNLLRSQQWSFVILQAQKYSESGQFQRSAAAAAVPGRCGHLTRAMSSMSSAASTGLTMYASNPAWVPRSASP